MNKNDQTPCGLWNSPIQPELLSQISSIKDAQLMTDGTIVWIDSIDGNTDLNVKRHSDAQQKIVTGRKISGTLGYGGGELTSHKDWIFFVSEHALYRISGNGGLPERVTRELGDIASPAISPDGKRVLLAHSSEKRDSILLSLLDPHAWPIEIASGSDFYMQPVWHPSGAKIAWIEWDHPQMPWDGTRLMMADIDDIGVSNIRRIAGNQDTPIFQPEFSPDGQYLSYISSTGEYDALFLLDLNTEKINTLVKDKIIAAPPWIQGLRVYGWNNTGIYYLETINATRQLFHISLSGQEKHISVDPYQWFEQISVCSKRDQLSLIAYSSQTPARVISLSDKKIKIISRSAPENIPGGYISDPIHIKWPAADGTITYALFYPPANPEYSSRELPPLIINVHGGPTSARNYSFNEKAIFFNSRGYAYVELNYRGSTGYGRAYMLKLRRNWGKIDVEDSVNCAKAVSELGLADSRRIVIMGGSAGGYTTLNALINYPGVFKLGINLYGVSNLFDFMIETHKFEERYNDSLVGVFPKDFAIIKEYSPSERLDEIRDPMLIFQGDEDPVVPKAHSEIVVKALQQNSIPYIYRVYQGEGHGFKKIANIVDMYHTIDNALKNWVLIK